MALQLPEPTGILHSHLSTEFTLICVALASVEFVSAAHTLSITMPPCKHHIFKIIEQQSYLTGCEFEGNACVHNPEHIELETELTIDVQSLNKFTSLKVGVAFIPDSPIEPILPLTPGSPIGPISPSAP